MIEKLAKRVYPFRGVLWGTEIILIVIGLVCAIKYHNIVPTIIALCYVGFFTLLSASDKWCKRKGGENGNK